MRILTAGRLLAGAAVMLVAAPVATISLAGTASASTTSAGAVVCTHLHGNAATLTAKLKGCPTGSTGGTGGIVNFVPNGGKVNWANGTTTKYSATATNPATGCPSGDTTYKIVGSVTKSTNTNTPVGQAVKMKVCLEPTGVIVNAPGTTVDF